MNLCVEKKGNQHGARTWSRSNCMLMCSILTTNSSIFYTYIASKFTNIHILELNLNTYIAWHLRTDARWIVNSDSTTGRASWDSRTAQWIPPSSGSPAPSPPAAAIRTHDRGSPEARGRLCHYNSELASPPSPSPPGNIHGAVWVFGEKIMTWELLGRRSGSFCLKACSSWDTFNHRIYFSCQRSRSWLVLI